MSRMFPWERWPTILIGSIYTCLLSLSLTMGSVHVVPSTCGYEFFLPPLPRPSASSPPLDLAGWVEVVACRDASLPPVSVTLTIYTVSGDVVHTVSVLSNLTARVETSSLLEKGEKTNGTGHRISASQKASAYMHAHHSGSDVMTLIPLDALSTDYLIPDLRTSGSEREKQHVVFYSVYSRTNVTVTKTLFSERDHQQGAGAGNNKNDTKLHHTSSSGSSEEGTVNSGNGAPNKNGNFSVKSLSDSEVSTTATDAKNSDEDTTLAPSLAPSSSSSTSSSSSSSTTTVKATPSSNVQGNDDDDDDDDNVGDNKKSADSNDDKTPTTTATPSSSNSSNSGDSSSSSIYNTVQSISDSVFFLSSALQTKTVTVEKGSSVSLRSDKPLGVVVVMVVEEEEEEEEEEGSSATTTTSTTPPATPPPPPPSSSSSSSPSSSSSLLSSSSSQDEAGSVVGGDELRTGVAMEMIPPAATFGKWFYLPLHGNVSSAKFVVSGQENASVELFWDLDNNNNNTSTTTTTPVRGRSILLLPPAHSLVLEGPPWTRRSGDGAAPHSFVWMVSTSPILVYVVTEICAAEAEGAGEGGSSSSGCDVNAFVLPPVEQYFRCVAHVRGNSCDVACPSFWNSGACRKSAAMNASDSVDEDVDAGTGGVMPGLGGTVPGGEAAVTPHDDRIWHVQHQSNTTSSSSSSPSDGTELCVTANSSYLPFRLTSAGSFLPAGTRLARLYRACVPSISEQGGDGDGVDNDCDGFIDEEMENMADDDGDGRIDEDTSSDCQSDVASRKTRSGDLQKAVADPAPVWPFADYEQEESEMPLFAVIISLSVAIFAVIAVISVFLLMELMSRRRQIRNTKIRPFVS
ncbi:uncharacterized protein LOC143286342 [Babylonia areolata]|uniref:uncharacterized protein LOC143286342 n=1 Tax=Babylonia areolata TaxID=304850 RepID=UPI003FD3087E